jgi:hypothetical protein
MKRVLIVAVALTALMALDTSAQAAQRRTVYRPARTWQVGSNSGGFFQRLMELERRKNEWLFGR